MERNCTGRESRSGTNKDVYTRNEIHVDASRIRKYFVSGVGMGPLSLTL